MEFNEYQAKAETTAMYPNKGNNVAYAALGLGEVGEVQNKVKKIIRDHDGVITEEMRNAIKSELGDVLWYLATMCTELNLTFEEVAQGNLMKLKSRKERNKITGSGDDR